MTPAEREWIHESVALFAYMQEYTFPVTGGIGRAGQREILRIHLRKGRAFLEGDEPETNAADALREAVVWYELRQRSGADKLDAELPRWIEWAYRLLPSAGLSRWGRLVLETVEAAARA